MDYTKLKVTDLNTVNDKLVISANFAEEETKFAAQEKFRSYFTEKFRGKKLLITGDNYSLEAKIVDIECTSNIIELKNIHFLTDLKKVGDIKINDLAKVIDY